MVNKTVYGGAAGNLSDMDIPEHGLPRHPFTGEILPRRNGMGVPQEVKVEVVSPDEEYVPVPYYDDFLGLFLG